MSIVWRDKVLSSYNGNLESVMVYDKAGSAKKEVPNGVFVTLDGLEGIGREVKKAKLTTDHTEEALLVCSPEVLYESKEVLDDFVNKAGKVARAFRLADGDVITLTNDLITGLGNSTDAIVGDKYVVADGKLTKVTATEDETATMVLVVRELANNELARGLKATRFDVVR